MGTPVAAWLDRDVVVCSGGDAATFLNGQLSAAAESLDVGGSAHTLLLEPDGKVVAWGQLVRSGDEEYLIVVAAGFGEPVVTRLARFRIRVDVDVAVSEAWRVLALRGDGAADAAASLDGWVVDLGWPNTAAEAVDVVSRAAALPDGLTDDAAAVERLRVAAGVPELGLDVCPGDIPAEAGRWVVDASVDFAKGCYVGQELVARVDSRGSNVPRRNCRIDADGPLEAGAGVVADGVDVGTVTSVAGRQAIARISRKVDEGAVVEIAGVRAVVVSDPGA